MVSSFSLLFLSLFFLHSFQSKCPTWGNWPIKNNRDKIYHRKNALHFFFSCELTQVRLITDLNCKVIHRPISYLRVVRGHLSLPTFTQLDQTRSQYDSHSIFRRVSSFFLQILSAELCWKHFLFENECLHQNAAKLIRVPRGWMPWDVWKDWCVITLHMNYISPFHHFIAESISLPEHLDLGWGVGIRKIIIITAVPIS